MKQLESKLQIASVKKYASKSVSDLKKLAKKYFNGYIRSRDKDEPCISCKTAKVEHAGHFYSAGHYPLLAFNEDNVHGQCMRCNYYLSGNLNLYRVNLEKKIGVDRLKELDYWAARYKRERGTKIDRFTLIEIIEKYKARKLLNLHDA